MDSRVECPGWEIGNCIGKGGHGIVYEIRREVFGDVERNALKIIRVPADPSEVDYLRTQDMDDESISNTLLSQVSDIINEYKLMSRFQDNPNIVHCNDFHYQKHDDGIGWVVQIKMELLIPLMKAMDKVQTEEQIVRFGIAMCNALVACHDAKVIHRDIKPQNIFVSPSGVFKLGDFGIARTMERTSKATAGIGTYSFMAPEVAKGDAYGHTADIYSLGLVLYWLLNERKGPFIPLPPAAVTYDMDEEARRLRYSGKKIPEPKNGSQELKAIVLKACDYDPKKRYQSAREMMQAFHQMGRKVEKEGNPEEDTILENLDVYTQCTVKNPRKLPQDITVQAEGRQVAVHIPGNIKEGQILTVTKGGRTDRRTGQTGNLYVTVHIQKRSVFPVWMIGVALLVAVLAIGLFVLVKGGAEQEKPAYTEPEIGQTEEMLPASVQETAAQEAPEQTRQVAVRVSVPDSWISVNLWAWSDPLLQNVFEEWPGMLMEKGKDGWFTGQVPIWADALVISGNKGTVQTEDLLVEKGKDVWIVVKESGEADVFYQEPNHREDTLSVNETNSLPIDHSYLESGMTFTFGVYEQDNITSNAEEPIEWLVLTRQGDEALVVSVHGLDTMPYDTEKDYADWESCSVRGWLEDSFYRNAFSDREKQNIIQKRITQHENKGYPYCDQGNDTVDHVFLLSGYEYTQYIYNNQAVDEQYREGIPSAYALGKGCDTYDYYKGARCWWWLRTGSGYGEKACFVNALGPENVDVGYPLDSRGGLVRPAMWISVK